MVSLLPSSGRSIERTRCSTGDDTRGLAVREQP